MEDGSEMDNDSESNDAVEIIDDSMHSFEGHSAGIYAVAWHPIETDLVATGGADDICYLWHVGQDAYERTHGAVVMLEGHTDTITAMSFNADGTLLASAGMDGVVRIWDVGQGTCKQALEGPADAVEWVCWHPRGNIVLAGSADFTAWMWLAETGNCMQVFSGHAGPLTCGGFTPDGKTIVTGGGEGDASIRVWDPKSGECKVHVQGEHFHIGGLTCLAFNRDSTLVLTGSEDGSAKLVSIESGRVIASFEGHDEGCSIEAVHFVPSLSVIATAGLDGKLIIWDINSRSQRAICQHPEGITRMVAHPSEPLLCAGCIDGSVWCWDARTGACVSTFNGHKEAVQDMKINHNGTMVLSGSEDCSAKVFTLTS